MWLRTTCAVALLAAGVTACTNAGLGRQYEYEEEVYLDTDGSATVIVNASLAALASLRGLDVPVSPTARVDRTAIRRLYQSPVTRVTKVSRPWRRQGRPFIQVRLDVPDIGRLGAAEPFAWSQYAFVVEQGLAVYRQTVGPPAGAGTPSPSWDGTEVVAFRFHLPSRILYHDAPSKRVERGNILEWEQPLRDRLAGVPISMEVRMEPASILSRTLLLFGATAGAAMLLLAGIVWWVWKKGRAAMPPG
jgi:hypothetical protein